MAVCVCPYDAVAGDVSHLGGCIFSVPKPEGADIVQKQIDGDPLVIQEKRGEFVSVRLDQLLAVREMLNEAISKYDGALEMIPRGAGEGDANFGFYVDGYTLTGTPVIGEILVTAMDGRSALLKSASLVAFLERRISPNVFPEDNPQG